MVWHNCKWSQEINMLAVPVNSHMIPIFFKAYFLCRSFFLVLIEFVTILLMFYVLVFWSQDVCDLSYRTRSWTYLSLEEGQPAMEDEILTTGSPGSPSHMIMTHFPSLALRFLIDEMRDVPYPTLANSWHNAAIIPTPLAHTDITD